MWKSTKVHGTALSAQLGESPSSKRDIISVRGLTFPAVEMITVKDANKENQQVKVMLKLSI